MAKPAQKRKIKPSRPAASVCWFDVPADDLGRAKNKTKGSDPLNSPKEWMEPGKPPTEAAGSVEMKMLLDGRFLQQDFTGEMMGQPYTGIGITGYDNLNKKYVSIWLDTMGTAPFMMEGTGSADSKTISLKGQHAEPGGGK